MWHNEWHLAEENITDETFDHLLQRLNNISDVTTARTNQQSGIISNMSKRELSSYSLSGNIQKRPREDKTSTSSSASSDEELDFDNNYSDTDNYDCMRDDDSSLHSLEERLQEMKKDA